MGLFFGFVALFLAVVAIVMLIINFVKKKSKKKPLIMLGIALFLFFTGVAMTPSEEIIQNNTIDKNIIQNNTKKDEVHEKTEKEYNEEIRKEAIKLDYLKMIKGEIPKKTKVYLTGEIVSSVYSNGYFPEFLVATKEGEEDEYGIYKVILTKMKEGETITEDDKGKVFTFYGVVNGIDESGLSEIIASFYE